MLRRDEKSCQNKNTQIVRSIPTGSPIWTVTGEPVAGITCKVNQEVYSSTRSVREKAEKKNEAMGTNS